MSESDKNPPAGMWVVETKLQSDEDPTKKFLIDLLRGILIGWDVARLTMQRSTMGHYTHKLDQEDPRGTVKLYGSTGLSFEEAKSTLRDLCLALHAGLEQQTISVLLGGILLTSTRTKGQGESVVDRDEKPASKLH